MCYTLDVAPDAAAAWRALDFETQEAVFDLLERLVADVARLPDGSQEQQVLVDAPPWQTFTVLWLVVSHSRQTVRLRAIAALTRRVS